MTAILILAAGQSTRMRGRDKLLEQVGGVPLLRRQVDMGLATGAPVFVAVAPDMATRQASFADLPATPIVVPEAAEGMSGTLRAAVRHLPAERDLMILLGDLVALKTADLLAVMAARDTYPDYLVWRGATEDGKPGHPVLFARSLRPSFEHLKGDHGADTIMRSMRDRIKLVPLPDQHARLDLDTPEDWAAWRATICGK